MHSVVENHRLSAKDDELVAGCHRTHQKNIFHVYWVRISLKFGLDTQNRCYLQGTTPLFAQKMLACKHDLFYFNRINGLEATLLYIILYHENTDKRWLYSLFPAQKTICSQNRKKRIISDSIREKYFSASSIEMGTHHLVHGRASRIHPHWLLYRYPGMILHNCPGPRLALQKLASAGPENETNTSKI